MRAHDLPGDESGSDSGRMRLALPGGSFPSVTGRRYELALIMSVALLGQADVWSIDASTRGVGTRALEAVGVLAFALALPLRHRAPGGVLVFMSAVGAAEALLVERRAFFFGQLVPFLIVLAAAASRPGWRRRALMLAVGYATFGVLVALVPDLQGIGNNATFAVGLAAAWGIGCALGDRTQRADSMALLAEQREEEAKQAVEGERARISRELHDVVAHNVGIVVLHAVAARAAAEDEGVSAAICSPLATIESTARETLDEMRRLVRLLDEQPGIAPAKLANLEALLERVRGAGLAVELKIDGEARPLPAAIDLSAYRIVQEALTNALKHAGHVTVRVHLSYRELALAIDVVDDGATPAAAGGSGGRGLAGMRERVALFNGTLEAGPGSAGGFRIHAELPLPA
jgi:signal transduction histidine kinase